MNRFTEAPRENFKFGGNFSYFTFCFTYNLTMTNLHYPQLLAELKLLSLNMFSKVPRGQIKKVRNFTLWFDVHSYGLVFLILACCLMNWNVVVWLKVRSLKWGKWSEYRCSHFLTVKVRRSVARRIGKIQLFRGPFFNKVAGRLQKRLQQRAI